MTLFFGFELWLVWAAAQAFEVGRARIQAAASVAIVFLGTRSPFSLEREPFDVEVSAGDAGAAQFALEHVDERVWATQVYLAFGEVGDEFA